MMFDGELQHLDDLMVALPVGMQARIDVGPWTDKARAEHVEGLRVLAERLRDVATTCDVLAKHLPPGRPT